MEQGTWTITYPSGERMRYKTDAAAEELRSVMVCVASDPETTQVNISADDYGLLFVGGTDICPELQVWVSFHNLYCIDMKAYIERKCLNKRALNSSD